MHPLLSARQEQCLRLTAFRTDKEIAAHLGISEATVKKHVHEACQRLGVNRRKAALSLLDPIVPDGAEKAPVAAVGGYPKQPMAPVPMEGHALRPAEREVVREQNEAGSSVRSGFGGDQLGDTGRGRLGYRVPPGNPALRIGLMVVLTILLATMVVSLVVMLGNMHEAVGKIDAASTAG